MGNAVILLLFTSHDLLHGKALRGLDRSYLEAQPASWGCCWCPMARPSSRRPPSG